MGAAHLEELTNDNFDPGRYEGLGHVTIGYSIRSDDEKVRQFKLKEVAPEGATHFAYATDDGCPVIMSSGGSLDQMDVIVLFYKTKNPNQG